LCFLEPARPAVDSRRVLFNVHSNVCQQSEEELRKGFFEELKDELPESCFIMMAEAEFVEEVPDLGNNINHPLDAESVGVNLESLKTKKNLALDDIYLIEQSTIGQERIRENISYFFILFLLYFLSLSHTEGIINYYFYHRSVWK